MPKRARGKEQHPNNDADNATDATIQPIFSEAKGQYIFEVGDLFSSYNELVDRLEVHTAESFVHYWRRDTRTVAGAIMKTARNVNPALKYYSVRYACVHGGQKYAKKGTGQRQTQ